MEWVRVWTYELRWAPGHDGVRLRDVDTPQQLRAVIAWARTNPHVEKCSHRVSYRLRGDKIVRCPRGHSLVTPLEHYNQADGLAARWVDCRDCGGHQVTVCPECGGRVYDPTPGPDCGPTT